MATLLQDLIETVCNAMKVPCQPYNATSEDGFNDSLDEAGASGRPVLLYNIDQDFLLPITPSKYGYLEYNAIIIFAVLQADETQATRNNANKMLLQLAYEFYCKMMEQDAWRTEPTNLAEPIRVSCRPESERFDSIMSVLGTTAVIKINPSFDRSNIC